MGVLDEIVAHKRAEVAALKILAKPVSHGGVQLNPAAESTMPYPEIPDPRLYAAGGPSPERKAEDEPTFASLFDRAHPSLGGRTYAQAMADELRRRGAFSGSPPFRVLSVGVPLELPEAEVESDVAHLQQPDITLAELGDRLRKKKITVGKSSISRFLDPADAVAAASGADVEVLDSRRLGGAWTLDQLWNGLGIAGALHRCAVGRRLDAEATERQLTRWKFHPVLCREAAQFKFATVCVNPTWVALAARLLKAVNRSVA